MQTSFVNRSYPNLLLQEIGEFQQAIYGIHQLLDLKEKETDIKVRKQR